MTRRLPRKGQAFLLDLPYAESYNGNSNRPLCGLAVNNILKGTEQEMIEVSHLTKKYGSHYAVQDLSFTLEKGKVYGLLGPNGAGKSTTMNMITGYIGPTSGEIRIDGHSMLEEAQEAKKQIGYLPEIPPLYPDMTVYEYLLSVAELKKIKSREKASAVEGAMAAVEITDMKSRLIRNLSKGYRQRTGIAQALIGNPKVIILDEPTVGLDPRHKLAGRV